jgi:ribonuclease-3 family protein
LPSEARTGLPSGPSSDWLLGVARGGDPSPPSLGPAQLAWLGDAVWELHQRRRRCRRPAGAATLHSQVVQEVRASAQAAAVRELEGLLTPDERDLIRRGRNSSGRGPRGVSPGVYGLASGFETMVGWLFLHDPNRLAQLLDHLEERAARPSPPPRDRR